MLPEISTHPPPLIFYLATRWVQTLPIFSVIYIGKGLRHRLGPILTNAQSLSPERTKSMCYAKFEK